MPFHSGSVTYTRLRVVDRNAPQRVDDALFQTLRDHAFQEREIGAPDEVEVGFITGEHLLDTQFSYEKNGYGDAGELLLIALRIDTHKVPADVKQAYRKINEQAAAGGNPSGFASKAQKRDAQEQAGRQVQEDLAAGKYRKSKMIPLVWDLARGVIYLGATSNVAIEQLTRLMRDAFNVEIELQSAGRLASDLFHAARRTRDFEDLHPSPFTDPPKDALADPEIDGSVPSVPWCAQRRGPEGFSRQRVSAVAVVDDRGARRRDRRLVCHVRSHARHAVRSGAWAASRRCGAARPPTPKRRGRR